MAHITFIHGIANKPIPEELIRIWVQSLAKDFDGSQGLDLDGEGITYDMVYWADVLYANPDADLQAYAAEAAEESTLESVRRETLGQVGLDWRRGRSDEEREWIDRFSRRLAQDGLDEAGDAEPPLEQETQLERIPIPWFLKRELMKILLRDVHHYLFNESYSPGPGETYRVQDEIRERFVSKVREGAARAAGGKHVVVSHSMGTVIAYDCLKRVPDCPAVDGLMTIGSPLGLDEIQDKLQPGWTRENGFPEKANERWVNVYDKLDPVAAFDPRLANDYRSGGSDVIEDTNEQNWGKWRHNISKYFAGAELRRALQDLLD